MTDLKTTAETDRVVDGSEYVRLATAGANWKVTLQDIFDTLGSAGTPSLPFDSVQFNNAGAFGGTGDFKWTAAGLTIGGATYNGGTFITTPGTGEFLAIGNYATLDQLIYAPGDSVEEFPSDPPTSPITVNHYFTAAGAGITNYLAFEFSSSQFSCYGMLTEAAISTDTVGDLFQLVGHNFQATNFGQGDIDTFGVGSIVGANCFSNHQGGGHVNRVIAARCFADTSRSFGGANGTCDLIIGVLAQASAQAITADTAVYGVEAVISALKNGSFNVTVPLGVGVQIDSAASNNLSGFVDLIGLNVDPQAGSLNNTGTCYNILSQDAGYLGTLGSTLGGNLFQGHSAFGNYADVNRPTLYPGNGFLFAFPTTVLINENYDGNLSGNRELLTVFSGVKHDGPATALHVGVDVLASILETSVGDFTSLFALFFSAENYGTGDIINHIGIKGAVFEGADSGTTTDISCIDAESSVFATGRAVTNLHGIRILSGAVGGGATCDNAYGLNIFDQSSIGGTKSWNIWSQGATSQNRFDGYVEVQETGTPPGTIANVGRIFCVDNGGGKTKLMVQFGSGAAQQIAIEP